MNNYPDIEIGDMCHYAHGDMRTLVIVEAKVDCGKPDPRLVIRGNLGGWIRESVLPRQLELA